MAKIYANLIKEKVLKIEDVPEHLRNEVQAILDSEKKE